MAGDYFVVQLRRSAYDLSVQPVVAGEAGYCGFCRCVDANSGDGTLTGFALQELKHGLYLFGALSFSCNYEIDGGNSAFNRCGGRSDDTLLNLLDDLDATRVALPEMREVTRDRRPEELWRQMNDNITIERLGAPG